MSDRASEIRERLDRLEREAAALNEYGLDLESSEKTHDALVAHIRTKCGCGQPSCGGVDEWFPVWQHEGEVYAHAIANLEWCLAEIERLRTPSDTTHPN